MSKHKQALLLVVGENQRDKQDYAKEDDQCKHHDGCRVTASRFNENKIYNRHLVTQ